MLLYFYPYVTYFDYLCVTLNWEKKKKEHVINLVAISPISIFSTKNNLRNYLLGKDVKQELIQLYLRIWHPFTLGSTNRKQSEWELNYLW